MRSACFGVCLLVALPSVAAGQDDGQLRLMREPHSYTDVADAADDDDPIDVNISLGFVRRWQWGSIQRERGTYTPAPGEDPNRISRNWQNVAHHEHTQNILELGLEIGIFRDLMIYGRMPIVLSDDRRLTQFRGSDASPLLQANDTIDQNGDGVDDLMPGRESAPPPLFALDFNSPTRSGLDYLVAGLAWSIFNQHRERDVPAWVWLIEGRFNPISDAGGTPLTACRQAPGGVSCRRWQQDAGGGWRFDDGGTNAGMSSGTNALRIETRASWRTRYVEPFAGLAFQVEWPANAERFYLPAGNLSGIVNERPPIFGELTGGLAIIPWENRADWQRVTFDLRFHGRYISEGHSYSPLFDALGTSQNRYLTEPTLEGDQSADPRADLRRVPFLGLTDTQSHAELGLRIGAEIRALRYLRFAAGIGLWYIQPYLLTFADACNPNVDNVPDGDARRGTCRSGIINPHHRSAIDLPGQRFRVDEQVRLDLFLTATGQF